MFIDLGANQFMVVRANETLKAGWVGRLWLPAENLLNGLTLERHNHAQVVDANGCRKEERFVLVQTEATFSKECRKGEQIFKVLLAVEGEVFESRCVIQQFGGVLFQRINYEPAIGRQVL